VLPFAFSSLDKSSIPGILAKIRFYHTNNAKYAILPAKDKKDFKTAELK